MIFAAAAFGPLRADEAQKPMQLADILAWKRIQTPAVSNDGQWLAYKVTPGDGNSEVVIRNLKDGKELRFAIGELPRPAGGFGPPPPGPPAPRDLAISDDSKWAAFLEYPSQKEAKALRKQHKPVQSKLMLVELATGNKHEFDKVRRFAFSGELSSAIAMLRYAPTPAPSAGPAAPAAQPRAAASGAPPAQKIACRARILSFMNWRMAPRSTSATFPISLSTRRAIGWRG